MQLKSVVLPAPFEPSTARRSPGRTLSVTSVSAASAPNRRVTPRSSSALAVPAAREALGDGGRPSAASASGCRAAGRRAAREALAPALPQAEHAVGREQHDERGSPARSGAGSACRRARPPPARRARRCAAARRSSAPMKGPIGRLMPPTTAMIRMSMTGPTPAVPGEIWPLVPDEQHAGDRGDDGGEGVGRDAVGGDVEAERRHAARIVAGALEREAEGRARDVDDGEIGEHRRRTGRGSRTGPARASRRRRPAARAPR